MIRARLLISLALGAPLAGTAALTLLAGPASAATKPTNSTGVRLKPVGRFNVPTFIASAPQDVSRLYVVERAGTIRIVRAGRRLQDPFLDIRTFVDSGGERGLLSMAFKPDYAVSGLFYVYYTAKDGALTIVEYRRSATNPDRAEPATRRRVMVIAHPNHNHNSGQLQFGPDGYMYAGTGDGGGSGDRDRNAQNLGTRLGKILRFDPGGTADLQRTAPPTNPFVGRPDVPPEIWAKGFRNPWRFSFDKVTGDLVIADVGQNEIEEVDFVRRGFGAGANFGWNDCEGAFAFPPSGRPFKKCSVPGAVAPVIQHFHRNGFCSVIGGVVVRDRSLVGLYGRYVYGDLCRPQLRSAVLTASGARQQRRVGLELKGVISFGQDANGCVFVGTFTSVYRVAPAASTAACPFGAPFPVANAPADRHRPNALVNSSGLSPALRTGVIRLQVRCDEPCRVEARASLARVKGKPLRRVLARTGPVPGGKVVGLTIRLRGARSLFAGRSRGFANLRIRVVDRALNVRTIRRSLRLVR
ncbi:MAG: PQQ-dependent sugar dehydrogenase [Solirubrobacteraceae bacterium]